MLKPNSTLEAQESSCVRTFYTHQYLLIRGNTLNEHRLLLQYLYNLHLALYQVNEGLDDQIAFV